jgi:putative CocE/NonD family hydrolase
MSTNTSFRILDSVEIAMRDGTILRANAWLPGDEGAWPVLLQRTAYRKDDAFGTQYISALEFMAALRRGYAVVVQDTRGRYASYGTFIPFETEAQDGADTIAWLREQPFCNGEVMMFGGSYVGATQVLAATGNPQGLIAVSPHLTTARHGETWTYRAGAVELAFLLLWIIESLAPEDLQRRLDAMPPQEADRAASLLAQFQRDPAAAFARLPILDDDLVALAPYAAQWFDGDRALRAAGDGEHLEALKASRIPYLVSCGWNDLFLEGALELFATVRSRWGNPEQVPDRLVIGPWSHGNPSDWQGDEWLGYAASTAGLSDVQLRFFDSERAGTTPDAAMVRYFRSGSNTWHAASDWPLPGSEKQLLFLGENSLHDAPAQGSSTLSFVSDTLSDPVPTVGGANFVPGLLLGRNSGPKDQATIESRRDVLLFTSDVLQDDLEVTGLVEAELWVSATGQSADWTARLCVVDAKGSSIGLVDGIIRLDRIDSQPRKVSIRIGHVSYLFAAGSRIRLQIASSNFPRFDRNPQSGVPSTIATAAHFRPATHKVHFGSSTPSCIVLTVISNPYPLLNGFYSEERQPG